MIGSAPAFDLVFFHGSLTPVTASLAKAAEEADREHYQEYKSDNDDDGDDNIQFVVVRGCSSGGCCGGSCRCRAGR